MSYLTGNVLSEGDYAREIAFGDDFNAATDRYPLRDALASLDAVGARYLVVSRETWSHVSEDGEAVDSETELSVIVSPSPKYIGDVLKFTQATREDSYHYGVTMARYYSPGTEFHSSFHGPRSERYCVDVHNVLPTRLAVIEASAS